MSESKDRPVRWYLCTHLEKAEMEYLQSAVRVLRATDNLEMAIALESNLDCAIPVEWERDQ